MRRVIYVPLEPYEERYTGQLSSHGGWVERALSTAGIPFERIEGNNTSGTNRIVTGKVLDGLTRQVWASSQITKLCQMAVRGYLTSDDIIYFDDFWTPGIEQFYYVLEQCEINPDIYSYCWAQSVDKHDFTYHWKWIRGIEKGLAEKMSGVFVANEYLADLFNEGIARRALPVGLPFDSVAVLDLLSRHLPKVPGRCVYTSRLDTEKAPWFFLDVAEEVLTMHKDASFVYCTGNNLRSDCSGVVDKMRELSERWGERFTIRTNCTKEEYYSELSQAVVQFNCALQDWVSFTLLEAVTFDCNPVYPNYRSFPETFAWCVGAGLYEPGNIQAAVQAICNALAAPEPQDFKGIIKRCDETLDSMFAYMQRDS